MDRAIVFGGSGFIGHAIVKKLVEHQVDVCAVVKPGFSDSPERFRLKSLNIPIVECDLRNVRSLPELLPWKKADVFYQLAWEGLSGDELTDYTLQLKNVEWVLNSIVVAAELGCQKFVGAGSISQDELSVPEGQMRQSDRHRIFRCAAQACEYMGASVASECGGIDFIWPIISNVYGEGELTPRLVTTLIQKLLRGETMPLSSGMQNYDFIYLSDAGEAFYLLGKSGKPGRRYNIASGESRALKDYLMIVRDIVAPNSVLKFGENPSDVFFLEKSSFDISILREDTGFFPKISFREGVQRTVKWIDSKFSQKKVPEV